MSASEVQVIVDLIGDYQFPDIAMIPAILRWGL